MRSLLALCKRPEPVTAGPGEINHDPVDAFSLAHAVVGGLLGLLGVGFLPSLLIATAWEGAEHLLKNCAPGLFVFPSQDTLRNAVGDVLATMMGWFLGYGARQARRSAGTAGR